MHPDVLKLHPDPYNYDIVACFPKPPRVGIVEIDAFHSVEKEVFDKYCTSTILYFQNTINNNYIKIRMDKNRRVILASPKCARCNMDVKYCSIELLGKSPKYVMHMYGVKDNKEVLFTIDHIIPKSKGGESTVENLQPMCYPCNCEKGDEWEGQPEDFQAIVKAKVKKNAVIPMAMLEQRKLQGRMRRKFQWEKLNEPSS